MPSRAVCPLPKFQTAKKTIRTVYQKKKRRKGKGKKEKRKNSNVNNNQNNV
jgi:hypothetical protein